MINISTSNQTIINDKILQDNSLSLHSNDNNHFSGNIKLNDENFIIRDIDQDDLLHLIDNNNDTNNIVNHIFGGIRKKKYNKSAKQKRKNKYTLKKKSNKKSNK